MSREINEIINFFQLFANIFGLVYRIVTIFLLTQRSRLGGSSKYFELVRKAHRKIRSGVFGKTFASKNGLHLDKADFLSFPAKLILHWYLAQDVFYRTFTLRDF